MRRGETFRKGGGVVIDERCRSCGESPAGGFWTGWGDLFRDGLCRICESTLYETLSRLLAAREIARARMRRKIPRG